MTTVITFVTKIYYIHCYSAIALLSVSQHKVWFLLFHPIRVLLGILRSSCHLGASRFGYWFLVAVIRVFLLQSVIWSLFGLFTVVEESLLGILVFLFYWFYIPLLVRHSIEVHTNLNAKVHLFYLHICCNFTPIWVNFILENMPLGITNPNSNRCNYPWLSESLSCDFSLLKLATHIVSCLRSDSRLFFLFSLCILPKRALIDIFVGFCFSLLEYNSIYVI